MGDEMLNTVKAIKTALGGESGGETYGSELLNTVIEIKDLVENGGGGGGGLPEVTSADEGKVLGVTVDNNVASAEWVTPQASSGLLIYDEINYELNASYNDLVSMLNNGVIPFFSRDLEGGGHNIYRLFEYGYDNNYNLYYASFNTVAVEYNNGAVSGYSVGAIAFVGDDSTSNLYFD